MAILDQTIRLGKFCPPRHNSPRRTASVFKLIQRAASDPMPARPIAAPGPWTASRFLGVGALLAALSAAALLVDLPIAQYLRDHAVPGEIRRLVRLSEVFGWGVTVAILIATAATIDPRGWRVVPTLAI